MSPMPPRPLHLAVVQVPTVIPRLIQVPGPGFEFVMLEELIAAQMSELFQGLTVTACSAFRITRDSDLNFDEEDVEDLLETIEQEVRKREWGDAVRLEVSRECDPRALQELLEALEITEQDVYRVDGPLNLCDFLPLCRLPDYAHLRDAPFVPPLARGLQGRRDLFAAIRDGDILLHHPFDSFSTVVDFVEQAATDPDVLAIKMTLYRTSGDSPIIGSLARAAENGKQVTALVELRARFDEENNIGWARALERGGVHVVYGLVGLKTHCKVLLVVRREPGQERLRRYVHLGTGNYHPATARLYTDIGLLTSSLRFGQDVSRLFNLLTGFSEFPHWRKLAVSPVGLRQRVLELIDRETRHALRGAEARIVAQLNSLVDPETIRALYRASRAGVRIDLIVRGICCLRAGVPGVSDNIQVRSIVGRFLEHCRILYFRNGGDEEVYLSSADWMPRNFFRRVEVLFPVDDSGLRRRLLDEVLAARLADNVNARVLLPDGSYRRVAPAPREPRRDSQLEFMAPAVPEAEAEAQRALRLEPAGQAPPEPASDGAGLNLAELYPPRSEPPRLPPSRARHPGPRPAPLEMLGLYDEAEASAGTPLSGDAGL